MFSLESFYTIIHENLIKPIGRDSFHFSNFGSTNPQDLVTTDRYFGSTTSDYVLFYDQEPIYTENVLPLYFNHSATDTNWLPYMMYLRSSASLQYSSDSHCFELIANSEHSHEKDELLKTMTWYDWYYFFHGFAALDWFRNFQYYPPIRHYSKVFITFNHLFTKKRSYRLNLIARIADLDGYISLNQANTQQQIKQELFSKDSFLSKESRKLILKNLFYSDLSKFVIDTEDHHGALSAGGAFEDLLTMSQGLFHVVTETIFYDQKLHLTEKIFKPIVARRPFILVAAPGNLEYLKSYGFKTFSKWIDESYDNEADSDKRIEKIANEIRRLCALPKDQLEEMYQDMQETIDYNFNWFYGGFKQVIVNELVDNFRRATIKYTYGRTPGGIDISHIDFDGIKKRLAQ